MKKALLTLLIGILAGVCHGTTVKNGSFSNEGQHDLPANWQKGWPKNQGVASRDRTTFKSAPAAMKLLNKNMTQDSLYGQYIQLEPNTEYIVSFWMKGKKIKPGKANQGGRFYLLHKGKIFRDGSTAGLWKAAIGTFDWTKKEFSFNTKKNEGAFNLLLGLRNASGTLWIDDVVIQKKDSLKKKQLIEGRIFPVDFQNGEYYLAGTFPGALLFSFTGSPAVAKGLKLILELPEGLKYIGSSPWWPSDTKNWIYKADNMSAEPITKNNKQYTRYTIDIDPFIIRFLKANTVYWNNYDRIYIQKTDTTDCEGMVFWRVKSDHYTGTEKRFLVKSLPAIELPTKKAAKFGLMISYLWNLTAPLPKVRQAYFDYWTALVKRPLTANIFGWNKLPEQLRQQVQAAFDMVLFICTLHGTPQFSNLKAHQNEFEFMIDSNGKQHKNVLSADYMINDPGARVWNHYFMNGIKEKAKNIKNVKAVLFDIEPETDYGYNERDRKSFQKFANLPNLPTREDIQAKHGAKWFEFKLEQHRDIIKKASQVMKQNYPDTQFWLCSDPVHAKEPTVASWCGVDVRKSDADVDIHANMPYYSGLKFYEDIEYNNKVLKKPNFPLIDPSEVSLRFFERYSPIKVKQNIIAAAALSCIGIGLWPGDIFDGRYLTEIATAYRVIGQVEDYYDSTCIDNALQVKAENVKRYQLVDNSRTLHISFPDFSKTIKHKLHRKGEGYLITLFNYNPNEDAILKLAIPSIQDQTYYIRDIESNALLCNENGSALGWKSIKEGFLTSVSAQNVVVLEITSNKGSNKRKILASTIQKQLKADLDRLSSASTLPSKKEGDSEVCWGNITGGNTPELKLMQNGTCLYIDALSGGDVISWITADNSQQDILKHKSRGRLGGLMFYDPDQAKYPYAFELKQVDINERCPEAVFGYTVSAFEGAFAKTNPMEGLNITKSIRLEQEGKIIRFHYEFTNLNPSRNSMKFGFRLRNLPKIGSRFASNKPITQISSILYSLNGKEQTLKTGTPVNNLFLRDNNKPAGWMKNIDAQTQWTPSDINIIAASEGQKQQLTIKPDLKWSAGFFCWWRDSSIYTVELLSNEISLQYGDSATYTYTISL